MDFENRFLLKILDSVPAFIYLQSRDHSIRYCNQYFVEQFGPPESGMKCFEIMWGRQSPCEPCPTFKVFENGEPQVWEWYDSQNEKIYEIHDYPFLDTSGELLVLEMGLDVTEKRRAELELEKATKTIKVLQGILPTCTHCKKIRIGEERSELGPQWVAMETYIRDNSEASFSHGICPDCIKSVYGENVSQRVMARMKEPIIEKDDQ